MLEIGTLGAYSTIWFARGIYPYSLFISLDSHIPLLPLPLSSLSLPLLLLLSSFSSIVTFVFRAARIRKSHNTRVQPCTCCDREGQCRACKALPHDRGEKGGRRYRGGGEGGIERGKRGKKEERGEGERC